MIDHMGINTADFPKSKAFYDAVFAALGGTLMMTVPAEYTGGKGVIGYGRDHPVFWVTEAQTILATCGFCRPDPRRSTYVLCGCFGHRRAR
jgi:hypothetical protein